MTLSIIIPTLNEAQGIQRTIEVLKSHLYDASSVEIIVVDAGSMDRTVEIVASLVDQVVVHPEFIGVKYLSLRRGAKLAKGDVLLFLDADCWLPKYFDQLVIDAICGSVVGGAFEFRMKGFRLDFKLLEWLNQIRYRIDKKYFGDQALFCSKEAYMKIGGFPDEPLMETAFLCRELLRIGEMKLIKKSVISSTRRFSQKPYKIFIKDFWIWTRFTFNLSVRSYATDYWKENIRRGNE